MEGAGLGLGAARASPPALRQQLDWLVGDVLAAAAWLRDGNAAAPGARLPFNLGTDFRLSP